MELTHFTDKQRGGLLAHYEAMFSEWRDRDIKYLEVGVLKGGSIEWAQKFFPFAKIVGVDIEFGKELWDIKNVSWVKCNQADTAGLEIVGKDYGEFDLIIDDGSHIADLTKNTFDTLWKFVKVGGWFIIEDWDAGYSKEFSHYKGMVELVADILIRKAEYGISDTKIVLERKSFAAFKKGK